MKLKKIASLMLAGIMAVSMLAGCGEGKGNGSSSSSSSQPTTTGVVAAVENAIKAKNSGLTVSVKESTPLNLQLKALFDQEENTYEKLMTTDGLNTIRATMNNVFGWDMATNNSLISNTDKFDPDTVDTSKYSAVIPVEKIAGMDATAYAADQIAAKFAGLSNSSGSSAADAKKVSYTLYVSAQTAVKANGDEVPVFVAALEVKVENKL